MFSRLSSLASGVVRVFREQQESSVQFRLRFETHATPNVLTPAGSIDLLGSDTLTEIAHVQDWKEAIGRLMVYGKYYPEHHKHLYLTGSASCAALKMIREHCDELRILLTVDGDI